MDITHRKEVELREAARREVLELLATGAPLLAVLETIACGLEKVNPGWRCSILLLDETGRHLTTGTAKRLPEFYNQAIEGLEIGPTVGSCGAAAYSGETIIAEDIDTHPNWAPFRELTRRAGLRACWSVPIFSKTQNVLGTFAIYLTHPSKPESGDIEELSQAANLSSIAIEQRQAEAALRIRETQLRLFIDYAPAAIAMFDRDLRFLAVSRRWLMEYLDVSQEVIGRGIYEVFPEIPDRWKASHQRSLAGAVERAEEDPFERANGKVQWVRWEIRPWYESSDKIGGIIVFSEDITKRKEGQKALAESQERFSELAQNISEVFWMIDPDGKVLYVSPAYKKIWGRSCESVYADSHSWLAAIHPDDQASVLKGIRVRKPDHTFENTYRVIRPDGSQRWVRDRGSSVCDPAGKIIHFVGVVQDVTESRALEAQYLQAQKMEAIGQLAGGVAHDFNNILAVIILQTDLLMSDLPPDSPIRESLLDIQRAADRAAALTRQLLVFSRKQIVESKLVNINSAVADTEKMLRRLIGEDVRLETKPGPGLHMVKIDPGHFTQVIMNLAVNARDAMPKGGRLTITTSNTELG